MSLASLRKNHPTLKNRTNKYLEYPDTYPTKTWVDMETDNIEPREVFPTYDYTSDITNNSSIITSRESELDGLYCAFPKLMYMNADGEHELFTCRNIYWKCGKCENCLNWRELDIMKKIWDKFDAAEVAEYDLYTITYSSGRLTPAQITDKIRYKSPEINQLMYTIDKETGVITYLIEGRMDLRKDFGFAYGTSKISLNEVLQLVKQGNTYRFLGKFYKAKALPKIAGLTREELKELADMPLPKKEKCDCGQVWGDHAMRQTNSYDMKNLIVPLDHYKQGHEAFKVRYFGEGDLEVFSSGNDRV